MKDVSIPEINIRGNKLEGLNNGGLSPSKRSILAFFAGGNHGPIRPILFKHWKRKDQDIQVYEYLPKGLSYIDLMRKSKYCLCPSGYEVASPRVVEALYNGCVPILISKDYVPPFSDVLDWKTFSVTVPIEEIEELKKRLMGIPGRRNGCVGGFRRRLVIFGMFRICTYGNIPHCNLHRLHIIHLLRFFLRNRYLGFR